MNKNGPIIVIEDDLDDQHLLIEIFAKLGYANEVHYFMNGYEALDFLNRTDIQPFLILSDINMPKINGFELRYKVFNNEELKMKCIPYLFFTTGANKQSVVEAYAMSVQGFFKKPGSLEEFESTIKKIVEYWKECIAPNEY
ncbi:response regulator [Flavipsychrobacter stenotrophus]|uniref:Response regulator n=1 Tax=Flavipsychrobacter stenotrophus TaxID=2077091 RepID=A0A2S7STM2_9BACT|nr:response regulator [Flavipsychrobacter stenotrophus]PQJ10282.1 response regulator [Flavipsychrobacter stenotrophus]